MNSHTNYRPLIPLLMMSVCLLFLGVNGIIGGFLMLSDPNGTPMGMPVSVLERTPFPNFFIPGLWLIFIWGCGSFLTLFGLWSRPQWPFFTMLTKWTHEHWAWGLSVGLGLALILWLTVQVLTLPAIAPVQYILFGLAVLLAGIPLLTGVRQYYRM